MQFESKPRLIFLHFARKTFNPLAGLKTDSRSLRRATTCGGPPGPCRTGHRVVGSGGRLQRPAGVEYYHVDYVGLRKRFYSAEGEMLATSINYEGLPPVAPEFDAAALRANILDSQRHNQPYREFTRRGPCRTGHRVLGIGGRLQRPHRRPAHGMVPWRRTVGRVSPSAPSSRIRTRLLTGGGAQGRA